MDAPTFPWAAEVADGFTFYRRPRLTPGTAGGASLAPVLFLNGCALAAAGWRPVAEALPDRDVLAIDRPGFGGTRWDGLIPDLTTEVAAVQRIITEVGQGRPVIVVAHSMASFRAEALLRLRPHLAVGLVLVDPSIEDYRDPGLSHRITRAVWLQWLGDALDRERIRGLAALASHRSFLNQIVSEIDLRPEVYRDPYSNPETLKSACAEWLSYRRQGAQLRTLRASTGRISAPTSAIFARPQPTPHRAAVLDASFDRYRRVDLFDSGHLIMIDRPDVIVEAVDDLDRALAG